MIVLKNGKEYLVINQGDDWVVSRKIGGSSIEYKVPKDMCENEESLKKYIAEESIF